MSIIYGKGMYIMGEPAPVLAAGGGWYKGTTNKMTITEINLVDTYTPTGGETESWDASAKNNGSVKAYINGTKLTIAGNGSGKIMANANSSSMFYYFQATTISGLDILDTSNVTNMTEMFGYCQKLTSLDVSSWNTSNVIDMFGIFEACYKLTSVGDLSNWNTSKATNMDLMFYYCPVLTNLNVSNFNTSNVLSMTQMFEGSTLDYLDVSNWNTSKVTNMSWMFKNCSNLATLDLSNWNTSKVTKMQEMFSGSAVLTKIYASDLWSTTNVTSSTNMFKDCSKLSGAISYDSGKTDATYANYTTGYLTYKAASKEE